MLWSLYWLLVVLIVILVCVRCKCRGDGTYSRDPSLMTISATEMPCQHCWFNLNYVRKYVQARNNKLTFWRVLLEDDENQPQRKGQEKLFLEIGLTSVTERAILCR